MILIDANIYLTLFSSNDGSITKLLPSLAEAAKDIFITDQIVFEVERNKLDIASKQFAEYIDAYKLQSVNLPKHLDIKESAIISEWNKNNAEILKSIKEHKRELEKAALSTLIAIQKGEDKTSMALAPVFKHAVITNDNALNRARLRKERGIPPGKFNDPLGDQITWELLIESVKGKEKIWIITNDFDYMTKAGQSFLLNPVLLEEVKTATERSVDVFVFNKLASGLKHYSENRPTPLTSIPSDDEIRKIEIEETLARRDIHIQMGWSDPKNCYACGAEGTLSHGIPRPSRFGGWTYQWPCSSCGTFCDFGEPYDD